MPIRVLLGLSLLVAVLAAPVSAQDTPLTKSADERTVPPPATLADLSWLTGVWEGEGIGGAPAQESYSAPIGGMMAGTFVQLDGEGAVQFSEYIQIVEQDGSLVVRLKHFDAQMAGWEAADAFESFALVAIEPDAAFFDGLTYRRQSLDGLQIAVRVGDEDGGADELVFRFRRADGEPIAASCADAVTTLDLNECYGRVVARADARMEQYLHAARSRSEDEPDVVAAIDSSQEAFESYREAECGAVYEQWKDGSIRGVMTLACRRNMADARTHRIWESWLDPMDATPPALPEPEPTS